MEQTQGKRNGYIDFLRGIAAINIIAIHTAFWGGEGYVPVWFKNLTLVLDVPFFFYLSGWASSYRKSSVVKICKSLWGIWLKWIFFISALEVFCKISEAFSVSFQGVSSLWKLLNNYVFHVSTPGFPVVAGSMWFMPYYFLVVFVNSILMERLETTENTEKYKMNYMALLLVFFAILGFVKCNVMNVMMYFLFYSFFWMMGMNRTGKVKSLRTLLAALVVIAAGICLTSYIQNMNIVDIQSAKFPPTLKYGFVSMISILVAKYFEGKYTWNCKFIEHIGKNAIFYYFGQGIGSSLNYYVVGALVGLNFWLQKWLITFFINIAITVCISELLACVYRKIQNIKKKAKIKLEC